VEFNPPRSPSVTYIAGLTLADIPLPVGYVWLNPGTVVFAGNNQRFAASFTGAGGMSVSGMITVNVAKAKPTEITWPSASTITFGSPLSTSTLSGGSLLGTFTWANGTIIPTVINDGFLVVFTPANTDNYDYSEVELTRIIPVIVNKANQETLSIVTPGSLILGGENVSLVTIGGSGTGLLTFTAPNENGVISITIDGVVTIIGVGSVVVTVIKAADDNYNETTATITLSVENTKIVIPSAVSGLVYNSSAQVGVPANAGYTISNNIQTNAGTYEAILSLVDGYQWEDGTIEDIRIRFTIARKKISVPTAIEGLVFNGSEQIGVPEGYGYLITQNRATSAGTYRASVTPTANHEWDYGLNVTFVRHVEFVIASSTPVDFTALNNRIASAKAITKGNHTDASWNALQTAISTAEQVVNNSNSTQAQVNTAIVNINTAVNNLSSSSNVSKAELISEIAKAKAILRGTYTTVTWNALQTAITAADAVYNNVTATQTEVDTAVANLKVATDGLVNEPSIVNKTALEAKIAEAKAKARGNYTEITWNSLQTAITAGEAVKNNANATQTEVDYALTVIDNAIKALIENIVPPHPEVDKVILNSTISNAKSINRGNASEEEWEKLKDAIAAAEAVVNNASSTQAQINEAIAKLENAIASFNAGSTSGFPWLAVAIIAASVAAVGGGGYYLYGAKKPKPAQGAKKHNNSFLDDLDRS
jgi:hypothetical protein